MGKFNRASVGTVEADTLLQTIQQARERAGLSQREVGRRLQFHATVYGKIERGERSVDVVEFVAIARAIGIDPIELLGDYLVRLQQARLQG